MKKVCFLLLFFLTSCVSDNGQYAVFSPKNVTLVDLNQPAYIVQKGAQESASRSVLATFIPFGKAPTVEDALQNMLKKYNGDFLQNVKVEYKTFKLMIYYGYQSWIVTADVMRFQR